jgi:hypothetical protein
MSLSVSYTNSEIFVLESINKEMCTSTCQELKVVVAFL